MYIGIDLGTSGVKAILLNEQGEVLASHTEKLTVSRPHRCGRNRTRALVAGDGPRDESAGRTAFAARRESLGLPGRCTAPRCWITKIGAASGYFVE
jgi:molecular chaperone DnaK (HSP70)